MKYFSCFSGIWGFELWIIHAYEQMMCSANSQEKVQGTRDKGWQPLECTHIGTEWLFSLNNTNEQIHNLVMTSSTSNSEVWRHLPLSYSSNGAMMRTDTSVPVCVWFSEIDKYATQIYKSHFPNHPEYGDITKINAEELPDFDCLVGWFPCQAFSIAWKRKWFEDTRGTLFFELARILQAKQPRLFVFENVKGLLSHDNGKTFSTIIATIDELGYDCQWQVLNSKNHWVPQNRERVYIIGHLRGTSRPKVFPMRSNGEETSFVSRHYSNTLTARYEWAQAVWTYIGQGKFNAQIHQRPRGNNLWGVHDIAPTMTGQAYKDNNHVNGIRRLTPVECERLQGFPDNWTDCVSDTQRYKCCGNAVTTNVVRDIFTSILWTALALPAEVQNTSQSENMRSATSASGSTPE